jgi:hypothetical protein
MDITLELVRQELRRALGFESFVATFVKSVRADGKAARTAQIDREGRLTYNPEFVRANVRSREDVFSLVMHELMHPLFDHHMYGGGALASLACDAVINAAIASFFAGQSADGALFRRLYRDQGVELILRPGCRSHREGRFEGVYESLYPSLPQAMRPGGPLTTGELIRTLQVLCEPASADAVALIGSHGAGEARGGRAGASGPPQEVAERIAAELEKAVKASRLAGNGDALFDMVSEVLRSHLSIRRKLLRRFLTERAVGRFLERQTSARRVTSPVMLTPSKRDLVLLASGVWPVLFHNRAYSETRRRGRGLAVYLDVSGSVHDDLPKILGVLGNMQTEVEKVFTFSNEVVETSLKSLAGGEGIRTTYGTDFDCVAASILERGYPKAVVITDGYADLTEEHVEALRKRKVSILTVVFGDGDEECEALKPFGPVMKLEDVVEACGAS